MSLWRQFSAGFCALVDRRGNVTSVREEVRGYGWENVIETFFADLRHAARWLFANFCLG